MDASCLSPETLLAWVDGKLADADRKGALAHVEGCDRCREALAALARIATVAPEHETVAAKPRTQPADVFGVGTRLAGRFRITRVLGVGGMGVVVAARDEQLARDVAIKLARPDLAAKIEPRLVREARAAAALHHPNLVGILDLGEVDGVPFLVMELVDGAVTLRRWIAETRPTRDEALAACIAAGRGLAALHTAGHLHRDIKPDNVLVARDGRVVLADFGLAKPMVGTDDHLTKTGAIVGTPQYLAPERVAGAPGDARADVYAFGVMTLEMVRACGEGPLAPPLLATLSRATDPDPSARWPAMEPLLAALAPRPRRRAVLMVGAALVVAAASTAVVLARSDDAQAVVADAAIDARVDAALDTAIDVPVLDAADAAIRTARIDPPSRDAAIDAAIDAPPVDAQTIVGGTKLTIEYLQSLGRGPAKSSDAETEVMVNQDGRCTRDAAEHPTLGWDWGKVERRELVDVTTRTGQLTTLYLYQIQGQSKRYLIDGAYSTRAYLDVPVGELVLLCPGRPREDLRMFGGWQGELTWSTYFGGPIAGPSTVLARKPKLVSSPDRYDDGLLMFLVEQPPKSLREGRFLESYFLEASAAHAKQLDAVTRKQPVWVLAQRDGSRTRYDHEYPVVRVVDVRRTLFDAK